MTVAITFSDTKIASYSRDSAGACIQGHDIQYIGETPEVVPSDGNVLIIANLATSFYYLDERALNRVLVGKFITDAECEAAGLNAEACDFDNKCLASRGITRDKFQSEDEYDEAREEAFSTWIDPLIDTEVIKIIVEYVLYQWLCTPKWCLWGKI